MIRIFFLVIYLIINLHFSLIAKENVTLHLTGINQSSDLNLFTHFILENKKLIKTYMPTRYLADKYTYKLQLREPLSSFLNFLSKPNQNFSLLVLLNPSNQIEITFSPKNSVSSNYPIPFANIDLEIEIRNSLETTQEYFFWYPKFQEKESNNNLLSYNPINANSKVFATLNGRGDKDFYSISTKNKKKWSLEIIILNKSNLKPVLLLFDKDANLIQKIALDKVKKRLVFHVSFPKSHNLGFIEIADDTVSGASFLNKIVTANYIFSVF